jgi:subtilisin family serine protease
LRLLAGLDWLMTVECDAVNVSVGPEGRMINDDPLQLATQAMVASGRVVVVAAGNKGPAIANTLAMARAPWVISVGAVDQEHRLLDSSSRGGNGVPGPTSVSLGQNAFVPDEWGTSFAAPRVARAAIYIERALRLLVADLRATAAGSEAKTSAPLPLAWFGIVDTGWDPEVAPYHFGPVSSDLISKGFRAIELVFTPEMRAWANRFVATIDVRQLSEINPELVRDALLFGATPVAGSSDEVGGGYIDVGTAMATIRNLTPSTICALLRLPPPPPSLGENAVWWDQTRIEIMEDVFTTGVRNSVARVLN